MIRDTDQSAQLKPKDQELPQGQSVDFVKLAWGHRWLLALGLALGLGAGFLYYTNTAPTFASLARVQIVEPYSRNLPVQGVESEMMSGRKSLADEALVMRSEKVLKEAVKMGSLASDPIFLGASPDMVAAILASTKDLTIQIAGEAANSTVFDISYEAESPELTLKVVQSLIDAYAEHLQMQHRNVGQETLELIQQARGDVAGRLEKLEDEFDEYRAGSALIYREGKSQSVHRDNADKFLSERQSLIVRQTQLASLLESAKQALAAGDPAESVLLAIRGGSTGEVAKMLDSIANEQINRVREDFATPRSVVLRQEKLLPLKVEASELIEQYGDAHPTVKLAQNRIAAVEQMIGEIEQSEADFGRKLEEARTRSGEIKGVESAQEEIINRVRLSVLALRQQLKATEQELGVISGAYDEEIKAARAEGAAEMKFAQFQREIGRQQELYTRIVARLDEMNIMAESDGLKVVTLDTPKMGGQIAPTILKSFAIGGFLGLAIAGALAYLIDVSDKSYHSAEQIAEHLRLPVIGHVPSVIVDKKTLKNSTSKLDKTLVTFYRSKSKNSEAFKAIRTALYFSNQGGDQKILQVTSAVPSDGKSTVAANSAIAIAQSGKSVLLIDSDMRRPRVQKLFGIETDRGLAWLLEEIPRNATKQDVFDLLGEAIVDSEVPNLSIMGAGMRPDNPSELLSSAKFDKLLESLRDKFDMVIIDSPPMLAVTDPSNVAPRVDGVILVVRVRKNVKPLAAQAARMLETLEANVIGVVVNGVGSRESRGYGKYGAADGYYNRGNYYKYGYGYSYGYNYSYSSRYNNKYDEYYDDEKNGKPRKEKLLK